MRFIGAYLMERSKHYCFHQGQKTLPFSDTEYEVRLAKLRARMVTIGIDACVLTSMHNVAYYSGFFRRVFIALCEERHRPNNDDTADA